MVYTRLRWGRACGPGVHLPCVHCMKTNGCNGNISIPSSPGALNLCRLGGWSLGVCVAHDTNSCGDGS